MPRRERGRGRVAALIGGALVVGVAVAGRSSLRASITPIRTLDWRWLLLAIVTELVSMAAFARTQRYLLRCAGAPIRERSMLAIAYGSNAISVSLPSGGSTVGTAYTYRQLVARGVDPAAAAAMLVMAGAFASVGFAILLAAGVVLADNPVAAGAALTGVLAAILVPTLVFFVLRRRNMRAALLSGTERALALTRRRIGRPRSDADAFLRSVVAQLDGMRLGRRDTAAVLLLALWNWLADAACLAALIRATGAQVPWHTWLLAYAVGVTSANIALTPGGIGFIEVALAAGLVAGGLDRSHAVAAALLYRAVSFWFVIAVGWAIVGILGRFPAGDRAGLPHLRLPSSDSDVGEQHSMQEQSRDPDAASDA